MSLTVPTLLQDRLAAAQAFQALIAALDRIGEYGIEEKKTCLHIVAGRGAFVGVHPRKDGLRLTLVMTRPLEGERALKSEKASARRYYNDVSLPAGQPVDEELDGWIREAYQVMTG